MEGKTKTAAVSRPRFSLPRPAWPSASPVRTRPRSWRRKIDASKPKNVILLVGDGMGHSEVTLGRYYGKGAAGRLNMDRLAFRGELDPLRAAPGPRPELPAQLRR